MDVTVINDGWPWLQNNRCGRLFKDGVDAPSYYIDAIVWKGPEKYDTFTGGVYTPDLSELISSSQFVKSFPFTPKTFHVDVVYIPIEEQDAEARGLHYIKHHDNSCTLCIIKDMSQLEEVFEYYNKK